MRNTKQNIFKQFTQVIQYMTIIQKAPKITER